MSLKKEEVKDLKHDVRKLIDKYRGSAGGIVSLLQEVQDQVGYLPREILEQIASGMKLSLAKVEGCRGDVLFGTLIILTIAIIS